MSRISTTTITCDFMKNGKLQCDFFVPISDDDKENEKNIPILKNIILTQDSMGNRLWFCGPMHLVQHYVAKMKEFAADPIMPETETRKSSTSVSDAQLETLKKMGVIVETPKQSNESPIPPPPEDLNLG